MVGHLLDTQEMTGPIPVAPNQDWTTDGEKCENGRLLQRIKPMEQREREAEVEAEVDVKHSTAFLNYAKGAGACVTALAALTGFALGLKSQCSPEEPKAKATAQAASVTLEQVSADVQKEHDAREQLAKALAADIKQVQGDVKSVLMLVSQHLSSHTVRPAAKKDDTAAKLIKKIDKRESTQQVQLAMPRPPLRKMKME